MCTSNELLGKTAIITGAARGLGLEISKKLGRSGANLIMIDICADLPTIPYSLSKREELFEAVLKLNEEGIEAYGYVCDTRDAFYFSEIIKEVSRKGLTPDILINNAGVISLIPIEELTEESWDVVVGVCLKGAFICSKAVIPYMKKKGWGRIINISSVAGVIGLGLSAHYCAAKHGLVGFTKGLALELAGSGITVNAICPGTMASEAINGIGNELHLGLNALQHFSRYHLISGPIPMRDVAEAVRWLTSSYANHVTGTTLIIDAGWTAGTK